MIAVGGCRQRCARILKEKRVLWVSIGSSGGELEAGRHEGTRGVPEEGVSRAEEGVRGVDRGALMNQFKCMR